MNAVRLDIIAETQDRATATLKRVQAELKKTEDQLRSSTSASKEDADVSALFVKARQRKIAAEVAEQEALAGKRRALVEAKRAQAESTQKKLADATATEQLEGKLKSATAIQEKFNKVIGLAGFAGLIVGAVSALASWVDGLSDYANQMSRVENQQARFNSLQAELAALLERRAKARLSPAELEAVEKQEELIKLQDLYSENAGKIDELESAINYKLRERARYQAANATIPLALQYNNLQAIAVLTRQINKLEREKEVAQGQQKKLAFETNVALREATPEYARHLSLAKQISAQKALDAEHEKKDAASAKKAADEEAKEAENKSNKAKEEAKARAEEARSRRAALKDEITDLRIKLEFEEGYAPTLAKLAIEGDKLDADFAAKRIDRREYELALQKLTLEMTIAMRDENRRVAEADKKASEDARKSAEEQSREEARIAREKLQAQKEADNERREALKKQGDSIRGTADAIRSVNDPLNMLYEGLGGISEAVAKSTEAWAKYKEGQATLGQTIAGVSSQMGAGIAGVIRDKRVAAGVEGAFEAAASIASFATGDIAGGIAHGVASAAFFAVAGGAGGSKGSTSSASASAKTEAPTTSYGNSFANSPEDKRQVIIVQNQRGIVYGMDWQVAQAANDAAESLRGTGMARRRFG